MNTMRVELFLIADLPSTEAFLDTLVEEYEGYTYVTGDGVYRMEDNTIALDEVLIVTLFVEDLLEIRAEIHTLMSKYRELAEQESVLYVINGNDAIFIKE